MDLLNKQGNRGDQFQVTFIAITYNFIFEYKTLNMFILSFKYPTAAKSYIVSALTFRRIEFSPPTM